MKKKLLLSLSFVLFFGLSSMGYTIYPIPQSIQEGTDFVSFTSEVDVVCEDGIDTYTCNRLSSILSEHGLSANFTDSPAVSGRSLIYLGIGGSNGKADWLATQRGIDRTALSMKGKFDRHILQLGLQNGQAELIILGEHTDAVFFGLASLEQMLDEGISSMKSVTIADYADQQSRGLVEGYYGYPYSVSVKKDLLRFMMRYKMNTYLYGAKSDPYHSEKWKDAYPTTITAQQEQNGWLSQQMIEEITQESQETKVNFIWAIHPGGNFISSGTVVSDIIGKFQKMYKLGVRQFGIFVDDVGLPSSDKYELNASRLTEVQQKLEALYNKEDALPADTVKPLHFVPQAYAAGFVNDSQREGFFTALASTPSNITIYTTGWGVWSIPNSSDLYAIAKYLGRDVAWWWNYPCNDNADGQIYTMDMYSNFYDLPAVNSNGTLPTSLEHGAGIVSNPMQEGELSKIALFSVADYAWNTEEFRVKSSWQAAVRAVVGDEAYDDYILLSDYLRYNDPADFNSMMTDVKSQLSSGNITSTALDERLEQISKACDTFIAFKTSEREEDRLFYIDIEPWLLKLKQMTLSCQQLLAVARIESEDDAKWENYVASLDGYEGLFSNEEYVAYALEGMGTGISVSQRISQPSERYFKSFLTYLCEHVMVKFFDASQQDKLSVISNVTSSNPMRPSTTNGYYTMTASRSLTLQPGEFVGLSLPNATFLDDLFVDEKLLSTVAVRYSANGKDWTDIEAGDDILSGYVKHIVFLNDTDAPQSVRPTSRYFRVTPASVPSITSISVPYDVDANGTSKSNLTDGDYTTWYSVNRNQANGDVYMLTLSDTTILRDVRICVGTVNNDYMNSARVEVSLDGSTWRVLKVKGSSITNFNLSISQVVTYSNEMKYCDFDGANQRAKYVRLRITNANTSKWLRLFEMEVNRHSLVMPLVVDGNGNEITEVIDKKAYTGISSKSKSLLYRFVQIHPVTGVTIYRNGTRETDAVVEVSSDGESWTSLGALSGSICQIDLTNHPDAALLRVKWNTKTPAIYEMLEQNDEEQELVTTGIHRIFINGNNQEPTPENVSSMRIFDTTGRLLYKGGYKSVLDGKTSSFSGTVLARYWLKDGSTITRKVIAR